MNLWERDEYLDRLIQKYPGFRQQFVKFRNNPLRRMYFTFEIKEKDFPLIAIILEIAHSIAKAKDGKKAQPRRVYYKLIVRALELLVRTILPQLSRYGIDVDLSEEWFWTEQQKMKLEKIKKESRKFRLINLILRKDI